MCSEEEWDTFYAVIGRYRRNKFFFFLILLFGTLFYILLWPKQVHHRAKVRIKERHPISYYLDKVKTNDTLFKLVLDEEEYVHPQTKDALQSYLRPKRYPVNKPRFRPSLLDITNDFDINEDVLVYLHIQKVGGTIFNQHLMEDLELETPCQCEKSMVTNPCHCKNKHGNIWLFSWFSVGWPCELHADWTMLHDCVDSAMNKLEGKTRSRRYFYITLLRDPVARYLSEWKHHRIGQHWKDAKLRCDGERVSYFDVRPCFAEDNWLDVTFDEFMDCRDNLATNRQTRMLSDLKRSFCYHRDQLHYPDRALIQLESALGNIDAIAFFGFTETQRETQKLFEKTFNLKFKTTFKTLNDDPGDEYISLDEFIGMVKFVELDIQLYQYAKQLFMARVRNLRLK